MRTNKVDEQMVSIKRSNVSQALQSGLRGEYSMNTERYKKGWYQSVFSGVFKSPLWTNNADEQCGRTNGVNKEI